MDKRNWNRDYKYTLADHIPSTKCNKLFTPQQKVFIQNYLTTHRDGLDFWDKNFLTVLLQSETYSEQQKETLEKIIKNK